MKINLDYIIISGIGNFSMQMGFWSSFMYQVKKSYVNKIIKNLIQKDGNIDADLYGEYVHI